MAADSSAAAAEKGEGLSGPLAYARSVARQPVLAGLVLAVLALAGWFAGHPFLGVVHDNRLYALQALGHDDPAVLGRDLFLAHGLQDRFTFFSPIYALAIRLFGLDTATIALTAAGQLLWLLCAAALIRAIVPAGGRLLAFLLVATFPSAYAYGGLLKFGEGFVTPRLFAEAIGLGAIAAFMASRRLLAVALLAVGALLHPLMTASPVAAIALMGLLRNRAPWSVLAVGAAAASAAIAALVLAHVARLPHVSALDPAWQFVVFGNSPMLYLGNWKSGDWMAFAAAAILLILASLRAPVPVARLLLSVLAVALAGMALSFAGFDILEDTLIGALQPWRAAWLLHACAPVALALLLADREEGAAVARLPQAAVLFALPVAVALSYAIPAAVPVLVLAVALTLLMLTRRARAHDPRLARLVDAFAWIALAVACGGALLLVVSYTQMGLAAPESLRELVSPRSAMLALVPAVVAAFGLAIHARGERLGKWPALAGAALLLFLTLQQWDRRTDWNRYIETAPDIGAELPLPIGPQETVYWQEEAVPTWVALRRASYLSREQGSGVIFSRTQAMEFLKRFETVRDFEEIPVLIGHWETGNGLKLPTERTRSTGDLIRLCANPSHPDVVVLTQEIGGLRHDRWRSPVAMRKHELRAGTRGESLDDVVVREVRDYFIYRCADVRAAAASSTRIE